ncbi:hypothetical protein V8C35DRAFT_69832 [Trichoderma chlorosporum]
MAQRTFQDTMLIQTSFPLPRCPLISSLLFFLHPLRNFVVSLYAYSTMNFFFTSFFLLLSILVGFRIRDGLWSFFHWLAPIFPLADSRLKQECRKWLIDLALSAFMSLIVISIVLSSDLVGRPAGP